MNRTLFAGDEPVRLGRRIGRGGEGEVFGVARDPARAAKVYAPEGAAAREAKIAAMAQAGLAERAPLVAFPQAALRDAQGRFAGFLMPRIREAEPLHELYAPGARKRAFPDADYRFLVRAALNAARAVAAAHRAGCVIGDVNHSGFLIGQDALVSLIDADSFQFDDGATLHLCRVGVPDYTPPEMIGAPLAETPRTQDHDAFGLAVVLFQLLFLGRHPFAGVSRGADLGVAEAIAQGAFAYARRGAGPLRPPPGALRLDEAGPILAGLFERAFGPGSAGRRPSATDWVGALAETEAALQPCPASPRHHFAPGVAACPLCRIERHSGAALFPAPGEAGALPPPIDVAEVLSRLRGVEIPEVFAYEPPEPLPSSAPKPLTLRQIWFNRIGLVGLAFMMVCAVGLVMVSPQSFLMAAPICIYGIGPVGDALAPRRAARRALAKLDRRLSDVLAMTQARVDLDAAWLLKADIAARAARLSELRVTRMSPKQRVEAGRLLADLERLEAMARKIAEARAARHAEIDALLARRALLAGDMARFGDSPPDRPAPPPRRLRPATRARAAA
ncbi:MAG: hypothetical protein ACFCUS_13070 [Rubrimonas sp.]